LDQAWLKFFNINDDLSKSMLILKINTIYYILPADFGMHLLATCAYTHLDDAVAFICIPLD